MKLEKKGSSWYVLENDCSRVGMDLQELQKAYKLIRIELKDAGLL